jgi:hypothetical protein
MLVGCVSFDCHPGSPFFSHRRCMLLSRLCLILLTQLALSPQKATPVLTTTLALSLSLLRRSLARSVCSDVPAGLSRSPPPAARTVRIALNFVPQKAGMLQHAGRPRVRNGERGKSGRPAVLRGCRRGHDATSDPPPRSRSPRRKSSRYGGN